MRAVSTRDVEAGMPAQGAAPLHAAALAAGLLLEVWSPGPEASSLRAKVTRELTRDLRAEIEALAGPLDGPSPTNAPVEGALRAADVASLAAASLAELHEPDVRRAAAAAHLAAGAARALCALAGEAQAGERDAGYVFKDARSAAWRAGLATRQADEALEGMGNGAVREA